MSYEAAPWCVHTPELIAGFDGRWRGLSNFRSPPVILDGIVYPGVEFAFQAAKTLNDAERAVIAACPSPGHAKRAGRSVTMREDWPAVRVLVMQDLLAQKFAVEPYAAHLTATGTATLIELNVWGDQRWGMVDPLHPKHPRPDATCWRGANQIGRLLMALRDGTHDDRAPRDPQLGFEFGGS